LTIVRSGTVAVLNGGCGVPFKVHVAFVICVVFAGSGFAAVTWKLTVTAPPAGTVIDVHETELTGVPVVAAVPPPPHTNDPAT
jgi:hypothetical protein